MEYSCSFHTIDFFLSSQPSDFLKSCCLPASSFSSFCYVGFFFLFQHCAFSLPLKILCEFLLFSLVIFTVCNVFGEFFLFLWAAACFWQLFLSMCLFSTHYLGACQMQRNTMQICRIEHCNFSPYHYDLFFSSLFLFLLDCTIQAYLDHIKKKPFFFKQRIARPKKK